MQECIRFCMKHKIVLLADEVYQENIYVDTARFVSFRKAALDMGEEGKGAQIASFHSISKGFFGECGRRGGYLHTMGFDEAVHAQLVKLWSINICSNIDGQIALDIMVNPPKEGEPSYALYRDEREAILSSLRRRAVHLCKALDALPGISCNPIDGSMYAFFKVILPDIMPGVFSGFIMALTMSIDDFVVSFFTTGSGVSNLSITIYTMAKRGISPKINALSTIIFACVFVLLIGLNLRDFRKDGRSRKKLDGVKIPY